MPEYTKEQIDEAKNWAIKTAESRPAGRGRRWLCGADMLCILLSALSTAERERDESRALIEQMGKALEELLEAVKGEPTMNNSKYDGIGITVNRALAAYKEAAK